MARIILLEIEQNWEQLIIKFWQFLTMIYLDSKIGY